jgi:hypothetical protein
LERANASIAARDYLQEALTEYWELIRNRLAKEPATMENMLVLKGEAKALLLLERGLETSMQLGEAASSES